MVATEPRESVSDRATMAWCDDAGPGSGVTSTRVKDPVEGAYTRVTSRG